MSDIEARFKGFQASLHAAGLRVARQPLALRGDVGNPAAMIIRDLVGAKTLPEGVVCATDQDALAIMDALADAGIDVPRQESVQMFPDRFLWRSSCPYAVVPTHTPSVSGGFDHGSRRGQSWAWKERTSPASMSTQRIHPSSGTSTDPRRDRRAPR